MRLKSLVVSLAALSLTATAVAAQQPANHQALIHALEGNSYEAYVPHNYLNGKANGFWLGAFGQISAAYNTNYLLLHSTYQPNFGQVKDNTLTYSLDNVDVLLGYDSNNAGFFADAGYSSFAAYDKTNPNRIVLQNALAIREAFATYQFSSNIGVKAGQFNSDFGFYNPYQPLLTQASSLYAQTTIMGVEAVVAMNQWHASVTGAAQNGSESNRSSMPNAAHPNIFIFNAGYSFKTQYGKLDLDASYANMSPLQLSESLGKVPAWLLGGHFATNSYSISAHVQNLHYSTETYQPWLYDANFNYVLNKKLSVGAYGNFVYNAPKTESLHWLLGLTGAYQINHYFTANVYAQRAQVTSVASAKGIDNNFTLMGALSVKI